MSDVFLETILGMSVVGSALMLYGVVGSIAQDFTAHHIGAVEVGGVMVACLFVFWVVGRLVFGRIG